MGLAAWKPRRLRSAMLALDTPEGLGIWPNVAPGRGRRTPGQLIGLKFQLGGRASCAYHRPNTYGFTSGEEPGGRSRGVLPRAQNDLTKHPLHDAHFRPHGR